MTRIANAFALTTKELKAGDALAAPYTCDNCRWPSVAIGGNVAQHPQAPTHVLAEPSQLNAAHDRADTHVWYPVSDYGKDFPDVPEHIASAADEAHRCLSIGAYRGALILARAVVEATCKDKEATGKQLYNRIEALKDKDFISKRTAEVAHKVRDLGNDMAHGDFDIEATQENASGVLTLMDKILDEVYQTPALLEQLSNKTTSVTTED